MAAGQVIVGCRLELAVGHQALTLSGCSGRHLRFASGPRYHCFRVLSALSNHAKAAVHCQGDDKAEVSEGTADNNKNCLCQRTAATEAISNRALNISISRCKGIGEVLLKPRKSFLQQRLKIRLKHHGTISFLNK